MQIHHQCKNQNIIYSWLPFKPIINHNRHKPDPMDLNKSQSCAVCQSFTTNLDLIQFKTDSQIKHKQAPGQSESRATGMAIFLLEARPPPLASACKPEHNQTNKTTKSQTGSRHTVSTQPRQVSVHISKRAHLWCADADATSCDDWKADCSAECQHTHTRVLCVFHCQHYKDTVSSPFEYRFNWLNSLIEFMWTHVCVNRSKLQVTQSVRQMLGTHAPIALSPSLSSSYIHTHTPLFSFKHVLIDTQAQLLINNQLESRYWLTGGNLRPTSSCFLHLAPSK